MDYFHSLDGELHVENTAVADIAQSVGTPCYIYSRATLEKHWHAFDKAFGKHPHLVCFAVKANSNIGVLNVLAKLGSGFDIVSGGELQRVIAAGGDTTKVVFSGVAKTREDIALALKHNIKSINIESPAELHRVAEVACSLNVKAPISIRVNPDVDPQTHPYISTGLEEAKFGIPMEQAIHVYREANTLDSIELVGIACHIGSQITTTAPFIDALERVIDLVKNLAAMGIEIQHLDLGGGLGIPYNGEKPPSPETYIQALLKTLNDAGINLPISIEPGRAIAGNAGILVTQVEYLKSNDGKNFAIVDAAMNDLLRPSLYDAWHQIEPVSTTSDSNKRLDKNSKENPRTEVYDIVGPVCETGDILGKDRSLSIQDGDLLAIRSAGAYGFVMSSNYNTRARAAEVIADKDHWQIVRRRETIEELYALESTLDD